MPIFDQGYQHFEGRLAGHAWRSVTIAKHGALSLLRSWVVRFSVIVAFVPALALIVTLALWGMLEQGNESLIGFLRNILPPAMIQNPGTFRAAFWTIAYSYFFNVEMFVGMIFLLTIGPNLVSRDLRFNAFPLYFSRPLTRFDYFLGKLGVIGIFLTAVVIAPALFAYVMGVAFSMDTSVVADTYPLIGAIFAIGAIIILSAGTLMLAFSSLTRKSLYVGLVWVGFWLLTSGIASSLVSIDQFTVLLHQPRQEMNRWDQNHPQPAPDAANGEFAAHQAERRQAASEVQAKAAADWAKITQTDWRPTISYTANVMRLTDALLDTDSAYVEYGRATMESRKLLGAFKAFAAPGGRRGGLGPTEVVSERQYADLYVPQYPWYWSAGILFTLWVLCVWILSFRVKTLDRLK